MANARGRCAAAVAAPIPARKLLRVTAAKGFVIEVMVISEYMRGNRLPTAIRDASRSFETLHERRDEWQPVLRFNLQLEKNTMKLVKMLACGTAVRVASGP